MLCWGKIKKKKIHWLEINKYDDDYFCTYVKCSVKEGEQRRQNKTRQDVKTKRSNATQTTTKERNNTKIIKEQQQYVCLLHSCFVYTLVDEWTDLKLQYGHLFTIEGKPIDGNTQQNMVEDKRSDDGNLIIMMINCSYIDLMFLTIRNTRRWLAVDD